MNVPTKTDRPEGQNTWQKNGTVSCRNPNKVLRLKFDVKKRNQNRKQKSEKNRKKSETKQ